MVAQSDELLMKAYQAGDLKAFDTLYRRHSGKVYGFLRKRLSRREEVDEVFQQVFTKLHASRSQYDPSYPFTQWMFVMTKTVLLDHWRKSKRTEDQPMESDPALSASFKNAAASEAYAGAAALNDSQLSAFSGLSQEQRRAVELRVIDEASYEEIAHKLKRSEESVRQLVSRGLKRLRLALGVQGGRK
jgi:RNA polymerase sigma factor (sigma-70 family)